MEAYLVPVLAAVVGAFLTASVLGAVRLGRWWRVASGRARAPAALHSPGLHVPGDVSDPHFSRLAHRALGAALLIGLIAVFFFARPESAGRSPVDLPVAVALLAAWAAARSSR